MSRLLRTAGSARLTAIGLLAVVFAAGGLGGVAWERSRTHESRVRDEPDSTRSRGVADSAAEGRRGRDSMRTRGMGGSSRRGGGMPWYFDSLGLSDTQRASIDSIMRANQPLADAIMSSVMPRLRAVSDSTRVAIDAVLTPDQLTRLRAMPRSGFRRRPSGSSSSVDSGRDDRHDGRKRSP